MSVKSTLMVLAVASLAIAGCSQGGGSASTSSSDSSTQIAHAVEGKETATGNFQGLSGHFTRGRASVFWTGQEWVLSFANNFSFDGAPDPKVGFGNDGVYDPATQLAPLQSDNGQQLYKIPAGVNVGKYREVYVYCEKFSVPLGVAELALK